MDEDEEKLDIELGLKVPSREPVDDVNLSEPAIRPIHGYQLGSIYIEKPNPRRRAKGGRKWVPPKVSMTAPQFCRDQGFSLSTCFECQLPECYFAMQPERINKKRRS